LREFEISGRPQKIQKKKHGQKNWFMAGGTPISLDKFTPSSKRRQGIIPVIPTLLAKSSIKKKTSEANIITVLPNPKNPCVF